MATIRDRYILEVDTNGAERNIGRTRGAIGGMAASLARVGPAAVAAGTALGAIAIGSVVSETADAMDDMVKAAREIGAATTEADFSRYQEIREFFNQGGVDAATFERGLRQLNRQMIAAATDGTGTLKDSFEELRPILTDATGALLQPQEAVIELQKALNEGRISQEAFQDAMNAVGANAGPAFAAAMGTAGESAASVEEAIAGVSENLQEFSLSGAQNAEALNDRMQDLSNAFGGVKNSLVEALLPALVELAEGVLTVLPGFIDGVKDAFARMEPFLRIIGSLFTEIIVPVLGTFFDLLGTIFNILEPLVSLLADGLVGAIRAVGDIVETVVGYIEGFIESLSGVQEKVSELTGAVGSRFTDMKDTIVDSTEAAYKGVTGWFENMYNEIVGNSIVPEMTSGVLGSFDELSGGMVSRIAEAIPAVINRFQSIAQTIGDNFERLTGISLSNIRTQVGNLASELGNRVESLATSISTRFQGIRDSVSGFANRIGAADLFDEARGVFAGLFANGGFIPPGQFGVVGERGPELISGPAQITPLDAVGSGANQNISYYIDAVDARSFREMIARDPGFIHAVAQSGARGLPRGRR